MGLRQAKRRDIQLLAIAILRARGLKPVGMEAREQAGGRLARMPDYKWKESHGNL